MSKLQQDMPLVSSNKAEIPDADESIVVVANHDTSTTSTKEEASKVCNWFRTHPGEKPYLHIYDSGTDLETLRKMVKFHYLHPLSQDIKVICEYLFTVIDSEPSILEDDWIGFDRTIGLRGANVGLRDMCDIKVTRYNLVVDQDLPDASKADDPWLCILYLSAIRLSVSKNAEYTKRLMATIVKFISQYGGPKNINLKSIRSVCRKWVQLDQYKSLGAATDMFLNKFTRHRLAITRICTIPSRYRGCASFLELDYFSKFTGLNFTEIYGWGEFSPVLDTELSQMLLQGGDELDKAYSSYFPYGIDFSLTNKSVYSVSNCPNFHFLVHAVGCKMLMKRSLNAHVVKGVNIPAMITIAILVITALSSGNNLMACFVPYHSFGLTNNVSDDTTDDFTNGKYPTTMKGRDWFNWYSYHGKNIPKETRKVYRTWSNLRNNRPDSMADFLKRYADEQLAKPDTPAE